MRYVVRCPPERSPAIAPLQAATIVVTRPVGSGASLARAAQRLGAAVVHLPGLRLHGCADAPLRAARDCDTWVFTSPAAVRFACALGLRRPAARVQVAAVGAGTRAALARRGIAALAPDGRGDSESLLALPVLADMRDRRVALFGAPGGRDAIAPVLRARGAVVDAVPVYQRTPPRLTRRHFDAIAAARAPLLMLVSSGEALANIVAALPAATLRRLRRAALVASSARIAALARDHGFADVSTADSALPRDLLAAAARRLAQMRT